MKQNTVYHILLLLLLFIIYNINGSYLRINDFLENINDDLNTDFLSDIMNFISNKWNTINDFSFTEDNTFWPTSSIIQFNDKNEDSNENMKENNVCLREISSLLSKYGNHIEVETCNDIYSLSPLKIAECRRIRQMNNDINILYKNNIPINEICNIIEISNVEFLKDNHIQTDSCSICKSTFKYIKKAVKNGVNPDAITTGANITCTTLMGDKNTKECKDIVNKINDIISWIKSNADITSDEACKKLNLCQKSNQMISTSSYLLNKNNKKSEKKKMNSCDLCTQTVSLLENTVKQENQTIEAIHEAMEVLCQFLPEEYKCHDILSKFDQIIAFLNKGKNPREICQDISLCDLKNKKLSKISLEKTSQVYSHLKSADYCKRGCMRAFNWINTLLDAGWSKKLILDDPSIKSISKMNTTPNTIHWANVLDQLSMGTSSEKLCKKYESACTENNEMNVVIKNIKNGNKKNPISCMLCQYTAQGIGAAEAYDNSTLPIIKEGMNAICNYLPSIANCDILTNNFDKLAKLLQSGDSTIQACSSIQMCGDDKRKTIINDIFNKEKDKNDVFNEKKSNYDVFTKRKDKNDMIVTGEIFIFDETD